ncbi:MAG: hypothetical protein AAF627_05230 [Myxococcota bacterium]
MAVKASLRAPDPWDAPGVRILVQNAPEAWTRELARRGHDLTILTSRPERTGADLGLGFRSLVCGPSDASLVCMGTGSLFGALAAGLRAPLVAHFDTLASPDPAERLRLQVGLQRARVVTAASDSLAERLGASLGIRGVEVLRSGFDLEALPLLSREEGRRLLGLDARQRVALLTGPMSQDRPVELLALAHRKVPGLTLLVVASGPRLPVLRAMTVATRPSSPVIILPEQPAALGAALAAADVGLALDRQRWGPESELYAVAGLPQVAFHPPGKENPGFVFASVERPSEDGLIEAIERALELPVPDPTQVARVRTQLGPHRPLDQIERLLRACASHSSSPA